jgi:hypothetical protein
MKKAATLILLLLGLGAMAQEKPRQHGQKHEDLEKLSPDQRADLQSKRMALMLDLNTIQQQKVASVFEKHFAERKHMKGRAGAGKDSLAQSAEARHARMSRQLDRQMALQQEMKKILSETQFEKWLEHREEARRQHGRKGPRHRQRRG